MFDKDVVLLTVKEDILWLYLETSKQPQTTKKHIEINLCISTTFRF